MTDSALFVVVRHGLFNLVSSFATVKPHSTKDQTKQLAKKKTSDSKGQPVVHLAGFRLFCTRPSSTYASRCIAWAYAQAAKVAGVVLDHRMACLQKELAPKLARGAMRSTTIVEL